MVPEYEFLPPDPSVTNPLAQLGPGADLGVLIADLSWLRALALRLVRDRGAVDDLVQETCVVALQQPDRLSRAWLVGVMRNLVRLRARGGARRRARERDRPAAQAVPTPDELCSRVETERRLASAVLALPEPFRETLLLRFSEKMRPMDIAEHLGVPPATVRSRLKRGLGLLREELDQTYGADGRAWSVLLLPLARLTDEAGVALALDSAALGGAQAGLTGTAPASWAAGALGAATLGALLWGFGQLAGGGAESEAVSQIEQGDRVPNGSLRASADSALADSLPAGERVGVTNAVTPLAQAGALQTMFGVVVDSEGQALGGLGVRLLPNRFGIPGPGGEALGRSETDGSFSLELPPELAAVGVGIWGVADANWTTVQASSHRPDLAGRTIQIVAAKPMLVTGLVVDEFERAVAGATIMVDLATDFRARFDPPLDHANEIPRSTKSDEQGRFSFPALPKVRGTRLSVRAVGYDLASAPLPETSQTPVRVVLKQRGLPASSSTRGRRFLQGLVLDSDGKPAPGAFIGDGRRVVACDDAGEFRLPIDADDGRVSLELIAVQVGRRPEHQILADLEAALNAGPTLRLDGEPMSLRGRVLDARGQGVSGAWVGVVDPTPLGRQRNGDPAFVESFTLDAHPFPSSKAQTDAGGYFVLDGLDDRPYKLRAFTESGSVAFVEQVRPGQAEVNLSLGLDALRPVRGRLVGPDGGPIAGVSVWLEQDLGRLPKVPGDIASGEGASSATRIILNASQFSVRRSGSRSVTTFGVRGSSTRVRLGELVTTDELGRFAFDGVPDVEGVWLVAWDSSGLPTSKLLDLGARRLDLVIPRRAYLQVLQGPGSPKFDRMHVEDARGERLSLWSLTGERTREHPWTNLVGQATDVVALPASAAQYVLMRSGEEVGRGALQLVAGRVTRITP